MSEEVNIAPMDLENCKAALQVQFLNLFVCASAVNGEILGADKVNDGLEASPVVPWEIQLSNAKAEFSFKREMLLGFLADSFLLQVDRLLKWYSTMQKSGFIPDGSALNELDKLKAPIRTYRNILLHIDEYLMLNKGRHKNDFIVNHGPFTFIPGSHMRVRKSSFPGLGYIENGYLIGGRIDFFVVAELLSYCYVNSVAEGFFIDENVALEQGLGA